ncbi:MAG: LptF/LptG family permease [Desulfomicrobium sp.]|jgi:lipopolysaccharide export system permease protein|nr:LptF/LptG family permease [Desulfomicrobium sp.]
MMSILSRYLLRQNMFFLSIILAAGLGVYFFVELFDRLDNFLEADVSWMSIASYFIYRAPFILAQIFPAVFLIALLAQLGLMLRNRELLALEACSVSPGTISRPILVYALCLACVQFLFSEVLGVQGYGAAEQIWNEEVRNRQMASRQLEDVWFREGGRIVHMGKVTPKSGIGSELVLYELDPGNWGSVLRIIRSGSFEASTRGWTLHKVEIVDPENFTTTLEQSMELDLHTNVENFLVIDPKTRLESLPLWQLGQEIHRLKESGSNIERLLTAWHAKLAYAFSVVIMAFIALALLTLFGSLYLIIPLGLVITFCYHGLFVLCVSAGENGLIASFLGAWGANLFFIILAGGKLLLGRSFHVG